MPQLKQLPLKHSASLEHGAPPVFPVGFAAGMQASMSDVSVCVDGFVPPETEPMSARQARGFPPTPAVVHCESDVQVCGQQTLSGVLTSLLFP
jgi:hypothetical protein